MKKLNTSVEIYNYLNIVCRRLGKLYKMTGYSPLPKNFDVDKEKFKEQIYLRQMTDEEIFPPFNFEDKNDFKKHLKFSLKNNKKIVKKMFYNEFCSKEFAEKMDLYFDMRLAVTEAILKDFRDHDFDEAAAYRELYNLNPILGQFMDVMFDDKMDFEQTFAKLEKNYSLSFAEKMKHLEKKNTRKKQAAAAKNMENSLNDLQNSKNLGKIAEKNAKIERKENKKQDIKTVKEKIKQSKLEVATNKKNKEI